MSLLKGSVHLNNVNIRPDKVNEILYEKSLPFVLRAGLISKMDMKVLIFQFNAQFVQFSILNLFSESIKIEIEDILFILGPKTNHISKDEVKIVLFYFENRTLMIKLMLHMMKIIKLITLLECTKEQKSRGERLKKKRKRDRKKRKNRKCKRNLRIRMIKRKVKIQLKNSKNLH